jgi:glycosyltransferase involved in cell wall biosynthesis
MRGVRVTIYGCGRQEDLHRLETHANLEVHLFSGLAFRGFSVPTGLIEKLRRNEDQIDLLVINTMFNPPNVAVARAATKGRIPYIVSPHDPYHPDLLAKNAFRKRVYTALFERPLLRNATAVQVLSPDHVRYLEQFGVRRALVIPNGFRAGDDNGVQAQPFDETTSSHGNPRFLCLGRLDAHHKGLDLLIRGFASALRSGILSGTATLNFVGPAGSDLDVLRKLAATEGVNKQVNFTGRVSDETRRAMLRDCDVLLLCSRYDGFGLVVLEAMLAAKPVVVSREAGISSWVEKARAGVIAEPSAGGVHAAIRECMARVGEWTTLGQNGRLFAYQHLTWDRIADHAARCYSELSALLSHPSSREEPMRVIGLQPGEDAEINRRVSTCL